MRRSYVIAVGVGLVLLMGWTARAPESGLGWRLAFVSLHLGTFVGLLAWLRNARLSRASVLIGAVLLRVAALPMAPTLSDDGYRYIWDGLVTAETEHSPYDFRPSDSALQRLQRETLFERINSPNYFSVYPPMSQVVFRVAALAYRPFGFEGSWLLLKVLMTTVELAGIAGLTSLASPRRVAVYAWSPLAVIEIAGQGHTEALVVAGVVAGVWAGRQRFPIRSIGAAIAGAAKLYPLALLPLAWRREQLAGVVASVLVLSALAVPVAAPDALRHASESFGLFYGTLDWFSAPYLVLKAGLYPGIGPGAGAIASRMLGVGFLLVALVSWLIDDGTARSSRRLTAGIVGAAVLSVATLHPWYVVPVLLMVPLLARSTTLTFFGATTSISYLGYVLTAPVALGLLLATWGATLGVAIWEWRSERGGPPLNGSE